MNDLHATADYERELRRLLDDLTTLEDDDKPLMVESLKQAVTALGGGFVTVAMAAAERAAGSIAAETMRKAAAAARQAPAGAVAAEGRARAPSDLTRSRPFRPQLGDENRYDSVGGLIRVAGVVSPTTLREISAEVLTFGEMGERFRRLLLDFTEATFNLDEDDWTDFTVRWLAAQPAHLCLGYVVADPVAHGVFDHLAWAGVNRGRINLLWQRREDSVSWLGF